ncbi:MAG: hypothetical protein KDA52_07370 [Planctomycetaceae bacterium]|nr:hypothetical protein [Planctomycetaceae bacterium]
MRLTLRTLLAYLDDILEPAQAKEIGEKIHESPFATSLVNKIQDVVRRRRIAAPELSGPDSSPDPNMVAEYLDNTLPADAVAELERICLESDPHLAEVAACHQILTLVLGEPVHISSELREHMYSQGAIASPEEPEAGEGQASRNPKVAAVGVEAAVRRTNPEPAGASLEDRLPPRSAHQSKWRNTVLALIGAIVLGIWMFSISEYFQPEQFGVSTQQREQQLPAGGVEDDSPEEEATSEEIEGTEVEPELETTLAAIEPPDLSQESAEALPPMPAEPEPLPNQDSEPLMEKPEPGDTETAEIDTEPAPLEESVEIAAVPEVVPDPDAFTPPEKPEPPVPVLPDPFNLQYVSNSGILVRHLVAVDDWDVLPRRSLLFPGEEFACPEPFDARLTVGDKQQVAEVVLLGGTRVTSLGASEFSRFGFAITQGRLVLSSRSEDAESGPVSLRLRIRDDEWKLDLLTPDTVVGIEVIPVTPTGVGDMAGATEYGGGIQLQSGSVRLTSFPGEQTVELRPEQGLLTFTGEPGDLLPEPEAASDVPDWLVSGGALSPVEQRLAVRYENEFIIDQPISECIRPVVKDRRPQNSELAAKTLALTGRLEGLVDALSVSHEETRIAAIEGIRNWLLLDEENGPRLNIELQDRFREDDAATINRLLWGYSSDDAKNEFTATELVNWLEHDQIAVRELAAYYIHKLTNRSFGYRAGLNPKDREPNVRRWREHVERTGALVSE